MEQLVKHSLTDFVLNKLFVEQGVSVSSGERETDEMERERERAGLHRTCHQSLNL